MPLSASESSRTKNQPKEERWMRACGCARICMMRSEGGAGGIESAFNIQICACWPKGDYGCVERDLGQMQPIPSTSFTHNLRFTLLTSERVAAEMTVPASISDCASISETDMAGRPPWFPCPSMRGVFTAEYMARGEVQVVRLFNLKFHQQLDYLYVRKKCGR